MSGAEANYLQFGDYFSFNNTARAKIFNRDVNKVTDMDTLINLLRFKNDILIYFPISHNSFPIIILIGKLKEFGKIQIQGDF
jgi:hypothetical protein